MKKSELSGFQPYAFRFTSGATLTVASTQYAFEMRKDVWCMGIYDNEHSGAVIGGATMRNHEVIYEHTGRA